MPKKASNTETAKAALEAIQAKIYHSRAARKELANQLIDLRAFRREDVERVLGQWIGTAKARLWAIPNQAVLSEANRRGSSRVAAVRGGGVQVQVNRLCDHRAG
jgi:hypothetical protein